MSLRASVRPQVGSLAALALGGLWYAATPWHAEQAADTPAPAAQVRNANQAGNELAQEPLPTGAVTRLGTLAFRHGRIAWEGQLIFTPDGKSLVSTGGGWIRRWDLATGRADVSLGDGWRVA